MRFLISLIFSVLMALCEVAAQGLPADYRRAEMTDTLFKDKIYNSPASFHWIGNTHQFWYLNHTAEGKQFILPKNKQGSPLLITKNLRNI